MVRSHTIDLGHKKDSSLARGAAGGNVLGAVQALQLETEMRTDRPSAPTGLSSSGMNSSGGRPRLLSGRNGESESDAG